MGSGKSTLGKILAREKNMNFIDFDHYLEEKEGKRIAELFRDKGEIYFRKREAYYLQELLEGYNGTIISLGGGTPCYGNAMEQINAAEGKSVYINVPVAELSKRLWSQRDHRPVLQHQDTPEKLEEFVRKHLFERSFYYNQAEVKIKVEGHTVPQLIAEMKTKLF